jgi:RNA polymerase sigma-70 factor, ECF subfamily
MTTMDDALRATERLAPSTDTIGAAATRDEKTFEAAVGPLFEPLVRRLVLVLGDTQEAQDIAQDAYLRAFRSWDQFDGRDVRAWLYTIALRLAFNHLRRRRRLLAILQRADTAQWIDRSDPDLWIAIQGLDTKSRAALLLNILDGYTQREIAVMFGVAEGTVASWLSRARSHLRTALADQPQARASQEG